MTRKLDIASSLESLEEAPQSLPPNELGTMKREAIEDGGTIIYSNLKCELWYHEKDGTTSYLPVVNHDYYAKKPDFHPKPTKAWYEKNKHNITCPVAGCGTPTIRVHVNESDEAHVELSKLLGAPVERTLEVTRRNAVIAHMQAFHPTLFADLVRQKIVTIEQAKLLRMGT